MPNASSSGAEVEVEVKFEPFSISDAVRYASELLNVNHGISKACMIYLHTLLILLPWMAASFFSIWHTRSQRRTISTPKNKMFHSKSLTQLKATLDGSLLFQPSTDTSSI